MKSVTISDIATRETDDRWEVSAVVQRGRDRRRLWFRANVGPLAATADPFVPAVLVAAMQNGLGLRVDGPVSEEVVAAAHAVQGILAAWHPDWRRVPIEVGPSAERSTHVHAGSMTASFFSGGVDSFHTYRRHSQQIDRGIFVVGFDIPVDRVDTRTLVLDRVREAASRLELPLMEVDTDIRSLSDAMGVPWEMQHGASLAAVGHLLAPTGIGRLFVPSTNALPFLEPYGSHPGLDPLWGTSRLEIIHDGVDKNRFEKIRAISDWDVPLDSLRVCWQVEAGRYNCGRCRKCLWTMAFLRANGVLDRAATFPDELDLAELGRHPARTPEHRNRLQMAIDAAGDDPDLAAALCTALTAGTGARPTPSRAVAIRATLRRAPRSRRRVG